ncbi:MAG TPA: hypothetical protein VI172_08380 [Candidatus Dormibacteraeota bacterium]
MTDADKLINALTDHGWTRAYRSHLYARMTWPGALQLPPLMIPLDPGAPEYGDMMAAAHTQLTAAVTVGAKAALALAAAGPDRIAKRVARLEGPDA